MTNKLGRLPWVLDSANGTDVLTENYIKIQSIDWIEPANIGDEVELCDGNNEVIWSDIVAANNAGSHSSQFIGWVEGLKLTKLDSGKVVLSLE